MAIARIHYQRIDHNRIRIDYFENVYTRQQLLNILGENNLDKYLYNGDGSPSFFLDADGTTLRYTPNGVHGKSIKVGSIVSKSNFTQIIRTLKKAGDKFKHIVRQQHKYKKKIIEI